MQQTCRSAQLPSYTQWIFGCRCFSLIKYIYPPLFISLTPFSASPHSMRQATPGHSQPSLALTPEESPVTSHPHSHSPSDRRNHPPAASHGRDASSARGRVGDGAGFTSTSLRPHSRRRAQSHSKSPESSGGRSGRCAEGEGLERRPSNPYGHHHRQTSIVHGSIQHSRNPSLAATSSAAASPLSPEIISAAGFAGGLGSESKLDGVWENVEFSPDYMITGSSSGSLVQMSPLSPMQEVERTNGSDHHHNHRKTAQSSKLRRENSHVPSASKHNNQEAKTVAEYALHHLFNSFVGQADEKINRCIMSLGELEAPVEQICGPGADPAFDQLIAALGHISKQKPKPLIDTIMVWRKTKGEAAALAKQAGGQVNTLVIADCFLFDLTSAIAEATFIASWNYYISPEYRTHTGRPGNNGGRPYT